MNIEEFPLVKIPPELAPIIGTRDGPSHVWRQSGSEEDCSAWFEALSECVGRCVSPGGVGMYCPVSRAAVHRRVKDGKLSMFLFHVTESKSGLFRRGREVRRTPYAYIPTSEAKAWKMEFDKRAVRQEEITREDLEGTKPDWSGQFMQWDSRWRKEQLEIGGPRDLPLTIYLSAKEQEFLDRVVAKIRPHFSSKEDLATHLLGSTIAEGMSGFSFMRLGHRMVRWFEESEAKARKAAP